MESKDLPQLEASQATALAAVLVRVGKETAPLRTLSHNASWDESQTGYIKEVILLPQGPRVMTHSSCIHLSGET